MQLIDMTEAHTFNSVLLNFIGMSWQLNERIALSQGTIYRELRLLIILVIKPSKKRLSMFVILRLYMNKKNIPNFIRHGTLGLGPVQSTPETYNKSEQWMKMSTILSLLILLSVQHTFTGVAYNSQ